MKLGVIASAVTLAFATGSAIAPTDVQAQTPKINKCGSARKVCEAARRVHAVHHDVSPLFDCYKPCSTPRRGEHFYYYYSKKG